MLEGDEWIGRLGSGGGPHSLIGEEEIYLERGDPKALVDHRYATEVEGKEKRVCSRERERERREEWRNHMGESVIVDEVITIYT